MTTNKHKKGENSLKNSQIYLLTVTQTAEKLGIGRQALYQMLPKLKARGLKPVYLNAKSNPRYNNADIDWLITQSQLQEKPIIEINMERIPYEAKKAD
jgi:hypothetical protein